MKLLFENVRLLSGEKVFVSVDGTHFDYIGETRPHGKFDLTKDCRGAFLAPAFYNTHCHAAMTLFRGYGDDLPLRRWLDERILPAEERLNDEFTRAGTALACAEMIKNGIVSFSDMYFFVDSIARVVIDNGMKANLSRSVVSFDENADYSKDRRFLEAVELFQNYNGAADGRVKIEMAIHAEYSNVPSCCRTISNFCRENNAAMQIHLSETRDEHEKCIAKRGITPTVFFDREGVFDTRTVAAHCVWLSDEDMDILAERGVYVSHNPSSNLKLGSGVMPFSKMKKHGVRVTLGTDGAASNNTLNLMKEMQLAAILHKGVELDVEATHAKEMFDIATVRGAEAQGRDDCGEIAVGKRADAVLIDLDAINNLPSLDVYSALAYSADTSNILMTLCDGRILYENGEYKSIDIERAKYDFRRSVGEILGK